MAGAGWIFDLKGRRYEARIARDQIVECPDWTPAAPLPLSLAKAEKIARAELRKLVSDEPGWEVVEFSVKRLQEEPKSKWFYLVELKPASVPANIISDTFRLPISSSGTPGQITPRP
jgi:hypothetical protein